MENKYPHLIIREPSTPQRHQSRSRQSQRENRVLGSPENRRTPAPPSQRIMFNGQQYNNLPENLIMGMERVQTLEQASARVRGSSSGHQRGQTTNSISLVS